MKDYFSAFRDYLIYQKSVSKNTLDSYSRDMEHFLAFLAENGVENPADATTETMDAYVKNLSSLHRSTSTITRNMASIRCFYQFLVIRGEIVQNPAKAVRLEKIQRKLPEILSGEEIELLFSQPDIREPKGCRDKAMLELLYATGIRVSELVELNVSDVNLTAGMLCCKKEGKAERMIPIYSTAIAAVSDYLFRIRNTIIGPDGGHALFTNLNGRRMTRQGFWKIIKGYTEQANITKEITPHTLRHSFALHLLENGAALKDIQAMLGHADISSTQIYVHLLNHHFKEVYNNCHPKAKLG